MKPIRVIQFGLGPIGCACIRALANDPRFKLVGAIDIDSAKIGRDAGLVAGLKSPLGIVVQGDAGKVLKKIRADAVLHTTGSFLPGVITQIEAAVRAGLNVVSSTEELSCPTLRHPALAKKLDALARSHGVAVLGTGVNPGFVMDALPMTLASMTLAVRSVNVLRHVDAATRREPLQRKVGAGMTPEEFRRRKKAGKIGHVGLLESLHLVAAGLGWNLSRATETLNPVIAKTKFKTPYFTVAPGQVCGIHHIATGTIGTRKALTMELIMAIGTPNPRDEIIIAGTPPLKLVIPGGTAGDQATVAALVNAIPRVISADAGLRTVVDLARLSLA